MRRRRGKRPAAATRRGCALCRGSGLPGYTAPRSEYDPRMGRTYEVRDRCICNGGPPPPGTGPAVDYRSLAAGERDELEARERELGPDSH